MKENILIVQWNER